MRYSAVILLVTLIATACLGDDWSVQADRWAEADVLFRRDSRWRGADAANSVDLGRGRVLWTFGDSFVNLHEDPTKRQRKTARFIRNSIAIQVGNDPTRAEFYPYWQEQVAGQPTAFFRSDGDVLFWPGGGLLVDDRLLIFLMRIRNARGGLGFAVAGWGAVLIDNPQDNPRNWQLKFLTTPQNSLGVIVGSGSILRRGDWVYAFSAKAFPPHPIFLVRFNVAAAVAGDLSAPQWWTGGRDGWALQAGLEGISPKPVVTNGQTEFTVHHDPHLETHVFTQFRGFPQTPIALRVAQDLTGPWSQLRDAYDPTEIKDVSQDLMLYAAKAHPEQACRGLAITYCTNTRNLGRVRDDETLYYPRFIRLILKRNADAVDK